MVTTYPPAPVVLSPPVKRAATLALSGLEAVLQLRPGTPRHEEAAQALAESLVKRKAWALIPALYRVPDVARYLLPLLQAYYQEHWDPQIPKALAQAWCPIQGVLQHEQSGRAQENAHYPYVLYEPENFATMMSRQGLAFQGGKFLDVGGGLGTLAFLARALLGFDQADSLEFNPVYNAVVRQLNVQLNVTFRYNRILFDPVGVIPGDALTFRDYSYYDVIYMYVPMRKPGQMVELHRVIWPQMKEGAHLIDVGKHAYTSFLHQTTKLPWSSGALRKKGDRIVNKEGVSVPAVF